MQRILDQPGNIPALFQRQSRVFELAQKLKDLPEEERELQSFKLEGIAPLPKGLLFLSFFFLILLQVAPSRTIPLALPRSPHPPLLN